MIISERVVKPVAILKVHLCCFYDALQQYRILGVYILNSQTGPDLLLGKGPI